MPHVDMPSEPTGGKVGPDDRTPGPDHKPSGDLGGQPINPGETAPREQQPNPPEGGNKQPRQPGAIETEPGQDL